MSSTADFEQKIKKNQKDLNKTISTNPLKEALKEIGKLIRRSTWSSKTKPNQLTIEHEKRENHIIAKKRERRERDQELNL